MVERSLENPPFDNLGEQILKRCGGVPLAIVLTAGMLREKTEHEWKRLLENMGQEKDKCSKIFALSYKDLPTELKPCFLYFGIFPEDYEILAFDLINLWAAEGFIRGSDTQEAEEVGNDYLSHLFARNLIKVTRRKFDGRIKSLRIHDILHGLCVTEAKEINFFNTPNAATVGNSVTKVRRVTTNHECISSFNNYGTPKLRAMLFFNGEDWGVDNFPRDLRLLRVISLECQRVAFPLPSEIGNWSHVTYIQLKVHKVFIELPSTISNLRNLLTLDVRLCTLLKFPYFIWRMKQLRHVLLPHPYFMKYYYNIELSSQKQLLNMGKFHHPIEEEETFANLGTLFWVRVSDLPASFCKFTNLRKLGIFFTCIKFSKLKEFLDADIVSHKLEILHLKCGDIDAKNHSKMVDLNLSRYENLFKLHLNRFKLELSRHNQLPPNLTKLTLRYTWLKEDPMETLKKLPKLEILELGYHSYMGKKLMVCSGEGGPSNCFPKLQVLEVDGSSGLNEFLVEEATMPKLSKLAMRYCYRLNMKVPDRIKDIMVRY
ncbi:unnamed protein product [Camellia sinensis]